MTEIERTIFEFINFSNLRYIRTGNKYSYAYLNK